MSTTAFDTAITQARDLLRWRSPLRTELWAGRLAAGLEASGQVEAFLRRAAEDGGQEARLALAALAALHRPATPAPPAASPAGSAPPETGPTATDGPKGGLSDAAPAEGSGPEGNGLEGGEPEDSGPEGGGPYAAAGAGVVESLPGWVRRMGRVGCDAAWYGKADPYGEQVLAVLSFRYDNGKEPHVLVVGIDQPSGGLAVDALVEEEKFLNGLDLRPARPETVAARVLDAFELTDRVMGAQVADTLPAVRPLAITRARTVLDHALTSPAHTPAPDHGPGRAEVTGQAEEAGRTQAADRAEADGFEGDLPDLPGAREAFGKLMEFVGDRPLWWSPDRAAQFLTQWLPREAILSDEAIAAMPEVVRAWTRHQGGHAAVVRRVDEEAPRLPALMADDSLASLNKRLSRQLGERPAQERPAQER
ncbi:hypothetical protein [Nonomuraea candida]|uniref:hypothetical protein n=1 Tax=Nonomuraea candida TaxID=359159 RepID=UPI0005BB9318|nr:hypothetical protein [Nonomuraea candida]